MPQICISCSKQDKNLLHIQHCQISKITHEKYHFYQVALFFGPNFKKYTSQRNQTILHSLSTKFPKDLAFLEKKLPRTDTFFLNRKL